MASQKYPYTILNTQHLSGPYCKKRPWHSNRLKCDNSLQTPSGTSWLPAVPTSGRCSPTACTKRWSKLWPSQTPKPYLLSLILDYAYTRKVKITAENVEDLLPAADQFNVGGECFFVSFNFIFESTLHLFPHFYDGYLTHWQTQRYPLTTQRYPLTNPYATPWQTRTLPFDKPNATPWQTRTLPLGKHNATPWQTQRSPLTNPTLLS